MTNIILCGGSGTRLWPISRTLMPKQFVKLFDNRSLFELTQERNSSICEELYIVSNAEQYFLAIDQLEVEAKFLLEPIGRNTAPAIALACMDINSDEIVLVTPSDHLIKDKKAYQDAIQKANKLAKDDFLVTFGITPSYPETGFGYIEASKEDVKSFKEKPDLQTAKEYLEKGNYYWNSGMFCFKAGIFLEELKKHSPKIYLSCEKAYQEAISSKDTLRVKHDDMLNIPEDSIDYAVMEKSDKVKVVPSDINWSDVGSFDALYKELPKEKNGNTKNNKHISIDSKNNLIISHDRQISTIEIEDLIIIDTPDALLISKKGSSQKVKEVVNKLKQQSLELTITHTLTHRPWGTYEVLLSHDNYKIKRIIVNPNKRLSLQKHYHRNEHWIVVSGTATVTVEEEVKLIRPNESTYIKMGEIHRLENKGKIPVVLIEAQVGEYTGEDDIIRIEDDFER
ncbi:MAG TPA: mannose-1-phosphate guanylyltransferase/mannose-6-phosphate isomerase [Campylobacterales bacterium]|nr:mannose-1-phosphate guanylyltransferase/mannose-6-phosphate isomerase [Campylobacterales bacterium]